MKCALLTIGTELTRGELENTNSGWLAEQLSDRGYEVTEMCTVDDDDDRIIESLKRLASCHAVIISTGGLGPTTDDRTSACAAAAAGLPLVRNDASLAKIKHMFESRGYTMTASNEKQADFPRGASILVNDNGTAPGFMVQLGACRAFFCPGVPGEMKPMFHSSILPLLPVVERPVATARLRTFGMPEAQINDHLKGFEEEHQVTIGYRASHSEIEVKVLAQGHSGESQLQLQERAEQVADAVQDRLGDIVYARGRSSIPQVVGELLHQKGLSLGLAESCTGGLVSELVTGVPGASLYYKGGVCSYANSVKQELLGVPDSTLDAVGAVSEEVARQMAEGAAKTLGVDVALSLTGIAGPGGGTEEKPVGLVHWAICLNGETEAHQRVFRGNRAQIQRRAALSALWTVRQALLRLDS